MDPNAPANTGPPETHYDYIIAGAGAAGLSLLVKMIRSRNFQDKKILLVDQETKTKNDRTWCFWESGAGFFEDIVYKKWQTLWFHANDFSRSLDIAPYQYKMIRGLDFYRYCLKVIGEARNVTLRYGKVNQLHGDGQDTWLLLDNQRFTAGQIFNSILFEKPVLKPGEHYLLQHFKGWVIETDNAVFNDAEATLMDFRVDQRHGASFVYVMPFSPNRALLEYTVFSEKLLSPEEYNQALKEYIHKTYPGIVYTVEEEEFGIIPMTNHAFPRRSGNIINIGTAGGQTKASSGYTFQFIQKSTAAMVENLARGNPVLPAKASKKFGFYDSVLLDVLARRRIPGDLVFSRLFRKNPPQRIFSFLDNESSLSDDLKLISTLPTLPFLKAGFRQVWR